MYIHIIYFNTITVDFALILMIRILFVYFGLVKFVFIHYTRKKK